jgi:hypothetical protein
MTESEFQTDSYRAEREPYWWVIEVDGVKTEALVSLLQPVPARHADYTPGDYRLTLA